MQLATQRKDPEESVYIAALAGLFLVSYLPIVALSSSVYWLEACRTAVCFIHIVRDTLVRVVNNKSLLPERERGIPNKAFSEEYTGIFFEILLHYIADTYLGSLQPAEQGSIIILLLLFYYLNCQIKDLTKFSCYTAFKKKFILTSQNSLQTTE